MQYREAGFQALSGAFLMSTHPENLQDNVQYYQFGGGVGQYVNFLQSVLRGLFPFKSLFLSIFG